MSYNFKIKNNMATYDPSKKYTWSPEDKFEFSGAEFGLILNTFRKILSTPEAEVILLANQANMIIEKKISEAVEKDVVKESQE